MKNGILLKEFIARTETDIEKIVNNNQRILDYYESSDFLKIKDTCEALMSTQREFNEYYQMKKYNRFLNFLELELCVLKHLIRM